MRRTLFLIGLLLEFLFIFGLFVPYVRLVQTGTPAVLETAPVDPRSMFRGDYVTLSYLAGRMEVSPEEMQKEISYNQVLYAILEKQGETYQRVGFSDGIPELKPGQICLRGTRSWNGLTFNDISQYFVPEGLGHEVENLQRAHLLLAEIVVDKECRAVITGLRLGQEANDQQLQDAGLVPPPLEMQSPELKGRPVPQADATQATSNAIEEDL